MARDGKPTRDKILTHSKALVFENGFSGTSIDHILERTGITKGAFFYHFKTKGLLAKALIEAFAEEDLGHMNDALIKTQRVSDKLQRLLQFVQEFIDLMSDLKESPNCLYASYSYEPNQFSEDIMSFISNTILVWRSTMERLIEDVLSQYDFVVETDVRALSDTFIVIFEGSFVLSKVLNELDHTHKQLKLFKSYLNLLFRKREI